MSLIACLKKDNDDSPIGTWKLNSIMINRAQHILSECEKKEKIVFIEKTFSSYAYKLGTCEKEFIENIPYEISNKKLNFSILGNKFSFVFRVFRDSMTITAIENRDIIVKHYFKQYN